MTIARWEIWSVANMLISAHGDDAEQVADENFQRALDEDASGDIIVWREVREKLTEIRSAKGAG